jgi:hypothetical protein
MFKGNCRPEPGKIVNSSEKAIAILTGASLYPRYLWRVIGIPLHVHIRFCDQFGDRNTKQ